MRTALTAVLLLSAAANLIGCQSAQKLAFWKPKTDAAESTALAEAAPELPSEIAKQLEGVTTAGNETLASQAPPYSPPAASGADSAAPAFPTTSTPTGFAGLPTQQSPVEKAAAAISPYDPSTIASSAPAATTPAITPTGPTPTDRYGYGGIADSGKTPTPADYGYGSAEPAPTGSPYADDAAPAFAASEAPSVPFDPAAVPPVTGGRYASSPPPVASEAPAYAAAQPAGSIEGSAAPVETATQVAEAQPYRPGGTASYPSSYSATTPISVAARPDQPQTASPSGADESPEGSATEQGRYR